MDRLISEQSIVDVLRKGYWDKNLQSAKDDPCIIDAMIDWAIRQIKAIPSAEPIRDMKEIEEVINCDADAEIKLKMISNILTAKPHYFEEQEPCEDAINREDVIALVQCSEYELQDRVDNDAMCEDIKKLPSVKLKESKTEKFIEMRDATPEEREAIDKYIKSISKPTGIEFDEEQEQIDFVQPKKTIPCTIKAQADRKQIYKKSAELRSCENLYEFVKLTQGMAQELEQEPCDDAISREDALIMSEDNCRECGTTEKLNIHINKDEWSEEMLEDISDEIDKSMKLKQADECISRQDIKYTYAPIAPVLRDEEVHYEWVAFRKQIDELPSVAIPSAEPKTGYWIAQDIYNCHTNFKCSECGYLHSFMHLYGKPTADYTYCPCCGTKMD